NVHLDGRFAGDAGHRHVRIGELGAHGVGHAHAHGAETARVEPAARLVEAVVLRGPHLVLADVGGDDGVAAGDFPQLLHHELRLDDLVGVFVDHAVAAAPFLDLLPPCGQRFGVGAGLAGFELADHLVEHFTHVAYDG